MALQRTSLSDLTYETLKERILDRKMAPGERLNIDALTRSLGVSSSPVREALVRLESERLVVLELYAGYTVAPHPTRAYLEQLYDFRIVVEGYCARTGAARRNAATVALLQALIKRMSGTKRLSAQYKEYKKLGQADAQFHQAIVDSACNEVMSEVYASKQTHLLMSRLFRERSGAGRLRGGRRPRCRSGAAGAPGGEPPAAAFLTHRRGGAVRAPPGRHCPLAVTDQTALPTSSAMSRAPSAACASPTGAPKSDFSSADAKPVTTGTIGPLGRPSTKRT
jgi:DNA-binding GntR family transcriptional regulator